MIPVRTNDLAFLKASLSKEAPLFIDTETCFLYKGIRLVQMFQKDWQEVLVMDTTSVSLSEVYEEIKHAHVVFHNYAYDAACFVEDLDLNENPFETFDDTLLLSRIAFPEKERFSLDLCFSYVHGFDVYEQFGVEKKEMQKSFLTTKRKDGFAVPLTDTQVQYAAADVFYLPKLWEAVSMHTSKGFYLVDKEFLANSQKWQRNGLPVDLDIRAQEEKNVEKELEEVTEALPLGLNVNSFVQVRKVLACTASAKDDLLEMEAKGNPIAGNILKKRKLLKLKNFLERFNYPRICGYFAPTAISGRARCDGGDKEGTDNLLQIPRRLKNVFGFPKDDPRFLVYCDYAQLELRTACCLTGEHGIEKAFRDEVDLHTYTGMRMFPGSTYEEIKNDKIRRQAAKTSNFSLLYCGSVGSLKASLLRDGGLDVPMDTAAGYKRAWLEAYPAFKQWHDNAQQRFNRRQEVFSTPKGRKYRIRTYAEICGIENQSLGADSAKLALNLFIRKEPNAKVLCFIHDSIILEAPNEEEAKRLSKILGESMLEAWFETIKDLAITDLPMPLDVNYGKNLATIEKEGIGWQTKGEILALTSTPTPLFKETKVDPIKEYVPPKELLGRDILFDADTIFYILALEHEDFDEALTAVKEYFSFTRKLFQAKSMKLFLTIGKCFRYELYPQYKANRNREAAPKHLHALKAHCAKNFSNVVSNPLFEADDLIVEAALANKDALVFAIDKDILNSLPGRHFNPKKREIVETSERDARRWPFLQAIIGDSSDNIPGVPGLGPKKAPAFLGDANNEYALWQGVVRAFESVGKSEEDALLMMRLVNMQQCHNGTFVPWQIPIQE